MKNQKNAYWIVTSLLCFGMLLGGTGQILRMQPNVEGFQHIGLPVYVLPIFGTWKFLAVFAILIPKYPLVKEWAHAGLFFLLSGVVISYFASRDGILKVLPVFVFMCLNIVSWYLRPANRKIDFDKQ
jgi:DoxX-like family